LPPTSVYYSVLSDSACQFLKIRNDQPTGKGRSLMERRIYTTESLRRTVHRFEMDYGLTSAAFYEAYERADGSISAIPGFNQRLWASAYRELREDEGAPSADTGEHLQLLPA
jgi:sigma54-dependent transcription regulator